MNDFGGIFFASTLIAQLLFKPSKTVVLGERQSNFGLLLICAQNTLRDWGVVREIGDIGLAIGALGYCLVQPHMGYRFYQLSRKTSIVQYGPTSGHYLEIFRTASEAPMKQEGKPSTVLVFAHGGGWGSGKPWMYRMIAEGLGNLIGADLVANVGYPVYPLANMRQQSESMRMVIEFLRSQGSSINVKATDRIVFAAHSSGAHVVVLYLLNQLRQVINGQLSMNRTEWPDLFLGLAGVYDIEKHYLFEAKRGVHQLSPMKGASGGELTFDCYSPTLIAPQVKTREGHAVLEKFPKCALVHGVQDTTVPYTSTVGLGEALQKLLGNERVLYKCINSEHAEIVTDLMFQKNTEVKSAIVELCRPCLH